MGRTLDRESNEPRANTPRDMWTSRSKTPAVRKLAPSFSDAQRAGRRLDGDGMREPREPSYDARYDDHRSADLHGCGSTVDVARQGIDTRRDPLLGRPSITGLPCAGRAARRFPR